MRQRASEKVERKVLPFEIKADAMESEIQGYASAFNNLDDVGDIVAPGAFTDSLSEFVTSGFIGGLNHDWDNPIGRPLEAREDRKGLWIRGAISDTEAGRDCHILIKDGVITKLSIGFRTLKQVFLDTPNAVRDYWRTVGYAPTSDEWGRAKQGARLITKAQLIEVSPVTVPANRLAEITAVKTNRNGIETERDFERFLREAGFSRREATAVTLHGFKAAPRDAEPHTEPNEPLNEEAKQLHLALLLTVLRDVSGREVSPL